MRISSTIVTTLFPAVFISRIPDMLRSGKRAGIIKKALSILVSLKLGKSIGKAPRFLKYAIIISPRIITLKEVTTETVDSGLEYPNKGYSTLIISPASSENEILKPTDRTSFSVSPNLFNRNINRMSTPGMVVKKKNPRNCLKKDMFKNMARSVRARSASKIKKNPLASKIFDF